MNYSELNPAELEQQLDLLTNETYLADLEYIDKDEVYQILEDNKKSFFASIVDEQSFKTTAEKERAALISEKWKNWIIGYQDARKSARLAKVIKDNKNRIYNTCQTMLWSKNKERGRI